MKKLFGITTLVISAIALTSCNDSELTDIPENNHTFETIEYDFSSYDTNTSEEGALSIDLDNLSTTATTGVSIDASKVSITEAGTYILSGTYSGSIDVNVDSEEFVHIILNNVTINNTSGYVLNGISSEKIIITLKDGTTNTFTDGSTYETTSALLYSKDDITINGEGTLNITANNNHAIKSADDLYVLDATINIESENDGLTANDSIICSDANISIIAGGDGIETNDIDKGYIVFESGTYNIDSYSHGIESETDMWIKGGTFDIESNDDGINANNDILIDDGDITLNVLDDAVHAEKYLFVNGGTINVESGYEGLEGEYVYITDGDINIDVSDDGINTAGVNTNDPRSPEESTGDYTLNISGGNIYIDADGDGLDSNGYINITGGTISIDGAVTEMGDPAIDTNEGNFNFVGGNLIAVGCDSMYTLANVGEQPVINVMLENLYNISVIQVKDADGNSIITFEPSKSIEAIMFSHEDIIEGETYSLYLDNTKAFNFEVSDTLLSFDLNGNEIDMDEFTNHDVRPGR